MDISTYINTIKTEKQINPVRKAIGDALFILSKGYIDIPVVAMEQAVYAPDIRKYILRSAIDILNYRGYDDGYIRQDLFKLATYEYGRDLRDPIVDILTRLADTIADTEIILGSGWTYDVFNCDFEIIDGIVTPLDPGEGVGGTELIPNPFTEGSTITVKAQSINNRPIEWCVLLYDSEGSYLRDETIDGGFSNWVSIGSRKTWPISDDTIKFRVFIRDNTAGLDISTIVSGFDDEDQVAIIQEFEQGVDADAD